MVAPAEEANKKAAAMRTRVLAAAALLEQEQRAVDYPQRGHSGYCPAD
jgi:hypothetical protein